MEKALREVLVPELRKRGFRGSLPHFRRSSVERVDYLSVQFNSAGGSFVVEVAVAGPDGKPAGYGKQLPVEKLNVTYFDNRLRVGSDPGLGVVDHWYEFGPKSYDPPAPVPPYEHFQRVAADVASRIGTQVEPWLQAAAERGLRRRL